MVDAVPTVAVRLLSAVPMLDDVIAMIRGLDGRALSGAVSPLVLTGVTVLRAAIDMELLERRGLTTASALVILDRDPKHNPAVLAALRQFTQVAEAQEIVQACTIGQLRSGMRLAEDVLTTAGPILIGRPAPSIGFRVPPAAPAGRWRARPSAACPSPR